MKIETTMRYDPDRDVVWIWQDRHDPFLVPRSTIEALTQSTALSEHDLFAACREHEARLSEAALRKYQDGEVEPDGRVVVRSEDL
jgi:hypothetical protein